MSTSAWGADPLLLIGAIIGGAFVGDNLAPISDTTIVSAYTQGTDVGTVVRTRLRYAAVAAALAIAAYAAYAVGVSPAASGARPQIEAAPQGLIMLVVPTLLIWMMLRQHHLVPAMLYCLAVGFLLGLSTGLIQLTDVLSIDPAAFTVAGIVVTGINSMVGIAVFPSFSWA